MAPSFKAAAIVAAPIFKRASSVQEQMEQKNLEERNEKLYEDAEKGDLRSVDTLLRGGAWPDAFKNDNGFTAMIAASANGHEKVVARLLEGGPAGSAEVDQQTRTGSTQLINYGGTPLMYAAEKGQLAAVNVLLEAGAAVDVQSTTNNTALICAAVRGHEEIVVRLLDANAEVDLAGEGGGSAMMKAAYQGRSKIVDILIQAGANVNMRSLSGEKALEWARKQGHAHVEELLLANGAISRTSSAGSYGRFSRAQSAASASGESAKA